MDDLSERPVLCNAHKGQALLEAHSALGALHNIDVVDVAIAYLLHLPMSTPQSTTWTWQCLKADHSH